MTFVIEHNQEWYKIPKWQMKTSQIGDKKQISGAGK